MTRRQRKMREVRMGLYKLWKFVTDRELIISFFQVLGGMLALVTASIFIALGLVLAANAIFHFGRFNADDLSGAVLLVALAVILILIRIGVWYYSDEE